MANKKNTKQEAEQESKQFQKEAELILHFGLQRITTYKTPLLQEWLTVENPNLEDWEQKLFDKKLRDAQEKMSGWSEEDLKMKFISTILELGCLEDGKGLVTFFDKLIEATYENTKLKVKADFMMAKGLLNVMQTPYFHFHEYKPEINPTGEPMAQLLQAFLIAQTQNTKPLYGVATIGEKWKFVVMEGKTYCTSKSYDCTDHDDLLKIIAILRKFRWILETRLMKDEE